MSIPIVRPDGTPASITPEEISELPPKKNRRLVSLDAYRGFVMLAMASSGLAFARVWHEYNDQIVAAGHSESLWKFLAYQFEHVAWAGCSFWDLIQPSFMFMVGVSMPFSYSRRADKGSSGAGRFFHALVRSLILIVLGVFLSSNWSEMTNFTFVNVLTQIGLGYIFVYLLLGRSTGVQGLAIVAILGGYWYFFYDYEIPDSERTALVSYIETNRNDAEEQLALMNEYEGLGSHWNKHTNAAAAVDRDLLNRFPRQGDEFQGEKFWINNGGYQTLNFIPSIATMIFGLMAGQLLIGPLTDQRKCRILFGAGFFCLLVGLAADTHIWPISTGDWGWTICPTVKRIWTPTWAVFSAGWSFLMMGMFFLLFDILGAKKLAFPLVVVGMNSIAFYVMAQLIKGWVANTWETHLTTVDTAFGTDFIGWIFSDTNVFADINRSLLVLCTLWLIALWMYRRKIFIRI